MTNDTRSDAPLEADSESVVDLRHYLRVMLKRKWVILAVLALGITATVIYTLRQIPIYRATASIIIKPQAPQVYGREVQEVVQLGTGGYWNNLEYYNTQAEILTGHDLAQETVRRHQLHNNTALVPPQIAAQRNEKQRIAYATSVLWRSVRAAMKGESQIAMVSVQHPNPQLAADLANKHVETYMANALEVRSLGTSEAGKILSSELDLAEERLRESEAKLYAFKKENGILSVALEDKLSQLAADLQRYNGALNDARIERIDLQTLRAQITKAAALDVLESPIFALVENTAVEVLKKQYLDERQKFLELSEELGPRNPDYAAQKKKMDDLHAAIEREARLATNEVEQRLAKAIATEKQFETEVARLTQQAIDLGPKTIQYNRLQREAQADEDNYNLVIGRLRTNDLTRGNDLSNISWHQRARTPGAPIYPRMKVNLALASLLSLGLGLLLAFLLEYMDRSIKSAEDVEQSVHVPVLGLIPMLAEVPPGASPELNRNRDLYVFQHPTSRAAECCRSIRTNILFSGADRELRVLTITSPNPREGKTTSVIYLGTTMAQSGQRVLLIDTDMRRPRLHQSMGVARDLGLSNLILGETSYEDAIKTTDVPNLFVLPCGPTPPNPAELLLTKRFQQVLADLAKRYDRIILDSPPLQAVADAAVLGRLSDGVILVGKSRKTNRDDLVRSARQLRDVQAPIVGVVINSLDFSGNHYGYYSYYGYAYAADSNTATEGDA